MEQHNEVITTPNFWDCECDEDYIHIRSPEDVCCTRCHATFDEQPDSRTNEVAALLGPEYENAPDLLAALKRLNREQYPEKYGYCFCGVAIGDPNYKGQHSSSCLLARAALAKATP